MARQPMIRAICVGLLVALCSGGLSAAEQARKHALIFCGLTGDAPHRETFAATVEQIYRGLTERHGFSANDVIVLWSEISGEADGPAIRAAAGPATREALVAATEQLTRAIQ